MLEAEVCQGGSRIVLNKFVVDRACCSYLVGMNEVEKGSVMECLRVPAE